MDPNVSRWPNAVEACNQLGISRATLERRIASGLLHPLKRQRKGGGRPELVFDPDEIQSRTPAPPVRAAVPIPSIPSPISESNTSFPSLPMGLREPAVPAQMPRFREEDIAVLVPIIDMVIERKRVRENPRPWLTLDEAAAETGLSRALLYRLVKREKLAAIRDGKIMIRREDLKDVDVRTEFYKQPGRRRAK